MSEERDFDAFRPEEANAPARSTGRRIAFAIAPVMLLAAAGGWAYENREIYGATYAQLFGEAKSSCTSDSVGCATAPGPCCHGETSCGIPEILAVREPVEAPKPPDAFAATANAANASSL